MHRSRERNAEMKPSSVSYINTHRHKTKKEKKQQQDEQLFDGKQKHVSRGHQAPGCIIFLFFLKAQGTYPEYDVESEDEILDAAAHFMSLEMLSGDHLDGFCVRRCPQ